MPELRSTLQATLGSSYSIERELGGGGMSRVFLAEEQALGRKVVVKILPPDITAGVNLERFRREILVSAKLQHPHIVPVLSTGEIPGTNGNAGIPYYTMPFVEGESLRARIARVGPLSITEAVGVLRDVAKALAYAHEHNVAHRDIKPDNILLSGGSATVADFGIAKAISAARGDAAGSTLTQLGTSIGTPAYMSPEQAAADPSTNHRADIYAFGCVAYDVLAGRPPFTAKTPQRLLAAHMGEKPQPITELRPDTPPALADLVMKCLEKDADARPQNASELVRVLETVTSGGGHSALPPILLGGPGMFRRALGYYAAAFVTVLIVSQAAVIAIGLPGWVVPGATVVMLMGLPVILFTGYVQRVTRRAITLTPTFTPGGTPSMPQGTMATLAIRASPHVSWSRAAKGGMVTLGAFVFLVAAFMILRALGIGPAGSLLAAGKLSDRAQLLISDFRVSGADTTLGHIVGEALRTDLGQSSAIKVVPATTVAQALQRMGKPNNTPVDLHLGREIALRDGIEAILDGEITPLAGGYIITMRLVMGENGAELARFRGTADGPKDLLSTVDQLSRQLRSKIGESLKGVNATPPLEYVTTPSLEALRKYVQGTRVLALENDNVRAVGFLQEAVALDTAFAMAYRRLGVAMLNAGMPEEKRDSALVRAYRFRDRLTEPERYLTVATYYESGPYRNRDRATRAYEALLEVAPNDLAGLNNLGNRYRTRREFARAEGVYRRALALGGTPVVTYSNLASALFNQGKVEEARGVSDTALALFPDAAGALARNNPFLYHAGNLDSLARIAQAMRSARNAADRAAGTQLAANIAMMRGRLSEWARIQTEARAINAARGIAAPVNTDTVRVAWMDAALRGDSARAVQRLDALVARVPRPAFLAIASTYVVAGRLDRAKAMLARYDAEVRDSTIRNESEPQRHALLADIALAERRFADALAETRASDNLPDGPAHDCAACFYNALGNTYDLAGQPDSAIVYYEKYFSTPYFSRGFVGMDPTWAAPLHKRLGELYEAKGDAANAHAHFARFVELWKDADPDLQPKVAEARRRMARLRDTERRP